MNRVLFHVDHNKPILCKANNYLWNIHNQIGETMKKWTSLWDKVTEMENILYDTEEVKFVLGDLYTCLNITKTEEFESLTQKRLTKCIEKDKKKKIKRDTGWLSFLL